MLDHLPSPDSGPFLVVVVFLGLLALLVFLVIREFFCWFFKMSAIVDQLKAVNLQLLDISAANLACLTELLKTNEALARIAPPASPPASGGNPSCR